MDEDTECDCAEGSPAWMATFSDMATLLLTFFVLLLSFANMDVQQFHDMMGSVREAFGVQFETSGAFQSRSDSPASLQMGAAPANPSVLPNSPMIVRIRNRLGEGGLEGLVEAVETPRGVSLRIRDGVLFGSGSDELLAGGQPLLTEMAAISSEFTSDLAIEGHTDDRPINTRRFPSNWELSAARATAVLRFVQSTGIAPENMSIAGYADTRPLAPNTDNAGRSRNRRVEFVFLRLPPERAEELLQQQDGTRVGEEPATDTEAEATDTDAADTDAADTDAADTDAADTDAADTDGADEAETVAPDGQEPDDGAEPSASDRAQGAVVDADSEATEGDNP